MNMNAHRVHPKNPISPTMDQGREGGFSTLSNWRMSLFFFSRESSGEGEDFRAII